MANHLKHTNGHLMYNTGGHLTYLCKTGPCGCTFGTKPDNVSVVVSGITTRCYDNPLPDESYYAIQATIDDYVNVTHIVPRVADCHWLLWISPIENQIKYEKYFTDDCTGSWVERWFGQVLVSVIRLPSNAYLLRIGLVLASPSEYFEGSNTTGSNDCSVGTTVVSSPYSRRYVEGGSATITPL